MNGNLAHNSLDRYIENWITFWDELIRQEVPFTDEIVFDFINGKWYAGSVEVGSIFTDKIKTFIFTGALQ